jgi:hypothetical protein
MGNASTRALNAHDLPSVGALVNYLHAAAGFPIKSTWLASIKAGNYASWPGLTYANASKYCPSSHETIKGHLSQVRVSLVSQLRFDNTLYWACVLWSTWIVSSQQSGRQNLLCICV